MTKFNKLFCWKNKFTNLITQLLDAGCDVNYCDSLFLIIAVDKQYVNFTQYLIENGIIVNPVCRDASWLNDMENEIIVDPNNRDV